MDTISIDDFSKVDIRIGTVTSAEVPEWSHWVIKLIVDLGEEIGTKTIFTGMLGFYKPEYFEGKQFVFVVNLKPKKIGPEGDFSEGMLMAASIKGESGKEEDEKPVPLSVNDPVPNGTKVR